MTEQFPLEAVVSVATGDAEDAINGLADSFMGMFTQIKEEMVIATGFLEEIADNTYETSDSAESSSQKQTQSWSRVGKAIGAVTVMAGGFLKGMVDASPELQGALDEVGFEFERISNTLGDALVPLAEALIPIVEDLADAFVALSPEIQTLIAEGVLATVMMGSVSTAASVLGISLGAVAWPILAIVAALALLYLAWTTNFGGIQEVTKSVLGELKALFDDFVSSHSEQFDSIMSKFKELWVIVGPIVEEIAGLVWKYMGENLVNTFKYVMNIIGSFMDILDGLLDVVLGLLTGDMDRVTKGLQSMFAGMVNIIISSINFLIGKLNVFFELLKGWDLVPDSIKAFIPIIPEIPMMHGGGIVGGSMGSDEVLTKLQVGEGVIDRDTMRRGIGGGITVNVILSNFQVRSNDDVRGIQQAAEAGARNSLSVIQRYAKGGYTA